MKPPRVLMPRLGEGAKLHNIKLHTLALLIQFAACELMIDHYCC